MKIIVARDKQTMGRLAAGAGAQRIREAVAARGQANIILATGASQFEMLDSLVAETEMPWDRVTVFHLDEYVGLPITHPASFRRYLSERFHQRLSVPPAAFHYINGEGDAATECQRLGELISAYPIDVAFTGIGENGHIAFNDPPADFETEEPYLTVSLDTECREQQLGEGWFATLKAVPKKAISMSCRQILKSAAIVCTVPDRRKAEAVRAAIEGLVIPEVPASILQEHADVTVYLDQESASLIRQ